MNIIVHCSLLCGLRAPIIINSVMMCTLFRKKKFFRYSFEKLNKKGVDCFLLLLIHLGGARVNQCSSKGKPWFALLGLC